MLRREVHALFSTAQVVNALAITQQLRIRCPTRGCGAVLGTVPHVGTLDVQCGSCRLVYRTIRGLLTACTAQERPDETMLSWTEHDDSAHSLLITLDSFAVTKLAKHAGETFLFTWNLPASGEHVLASISGSDGASYLLEEIDEPLRYADPYRAAWWTGLFVEAIFLLVLFAFVRWGHVPAWFGPVPPWWVWLVLSVLLNAAFSLYMGWEETRKQARLAGAVAQSSIPAIAPATLDERRELFVQLEATETAVTALRKKRVTISAYVVRLKHLSSPSRFIRQIRGGEERLADVDALIASHGDVTARIASTIEAIDVELDTASLSDVLALHDSGIVEQYVADLRRALDAREELERHIGNIAETDAAIDAAIKAEVDQERRSAPGGAGSPPEVDKAVEAVFAELDALIGMERPKREFRALANFLALQKQRRAFGLPTPALSLHVVLTGPPGTGKTTLARLLGKLYRAMGLLATGHFVETDRAGLVAGYIGQTALKVEDAVQRARGGVLFIDEAYSLHVDSDRDFGREAIETLLKRMEDLRGEIAVVFAGYHDEMVTFLDSNPGLLSRVNRYIQFEDYEPRELLLIFQRFCEEGGYDLEEAAAEAVLRACQVAHAARSRTFGNARFARNFFERCLQHHAERLARQPGGVASATRVDSMTLKVDDILS